MRTILFLTARANQLPGLPTVQPSLDQREQVTALSAKYLAAALLLHGLAGALVLLTIAPQRREDQPHALTFRILHTSAATKPETPIAPGPAPAAPPRTKPASMPPRPRVLQGPASAEAAVPSIAPAEHPLPQAQTVPQPAEDSPGAVANAVAPATSAPAAQAETAPRFDADYLDNPPPLYPALSRRMGEEGSVILRVYVEADGRPGQIQVHTGSGSERLDRAAQESVARWKFAPAQRGERPVGAWVLVPIQFSLRS